MAFLAYWGESMFYAAALLFMVWLHFRNGVWGSKTTPPVAPRESIAVQQLRQRSNDMPVGMTVNSTKYGNLVPRWTARKR